MPLSTVPKNSLIKDARDIYKYRYVISSYVETNLRLRYRRSVIGFFWTIIAPLLQYIIIAYVFKYASKMTDAHFFPYFFSGSVIFSAISATLLRAPMVMITNELYIKKIYLPKTIYVLNTCLYELTNFFFSAGALFLLGLLTGSISLSLPLLSLPIAVFLLFVTLIGLSGILSIGGVYFRDLAYILPPVMQAAFFLTPIVYRIEILPERAQRLMVFNPFYHLIEIFRLPITEGRVATAFNYGAAAAFALCSLVLGYWLLKRFNNRIIFKL